MGTPICRGEHCSSGMSFYAFVGIRCEFAICYCTDGQWPPLHPCGSIKRQIQINIDGYGSLYKKQKRRYPNRYLPFAYAERDSLEKVLPPSSPAASECPPDIRIESFSSLSQTKQKSRHPNGHLDFWYSQANQIRTEPGLSQSGFYVF